MKYVWQNCYIGSQDTLQPKHENETFHDVRDLLQDFETSSNLSSCQSEVLESQRRKKKARKARLRNIFKGSEAEPSSIVGKDPWSCNRSISLVRKWCLNIDIWRNFFQQVLTDVNGYKMPNINKTGRGSSEAEVNIQKSLSIASLPQVSHCMKKGKVLCEEISRQQYQSLKKSENAALWWFQICIS